MNILFLTAYPPVLDMHGGGVRMYHNIRILSGKHNVHVISFVEGEDEKKSVEELSNICESTAAVERVPDLRPRPWSLQPAIVRHFDVAGMKQTVVRACVRYDIQVLQCEYLQMTQFHQTDVFAVWTAHEVLSLNAYRDFLREEDPRKKVPAFYEWMSLLRYETGAARRFDRVITMTAQDEAYLRGYVPEAAVRYIPIGVDSLRYAPARDEPKLPLRVVFLGNFLHAPNVEAAVFLRDHVIGFFPELQFQIAGRGFPDGLMEGSRAEMLGYRADTRSLYRPPNTIVAAPLFSGTGQRVKLLEAFAMGMPVVTTSAGVAGFPVRNGVEAFVADSPEEYRSALAALSGSRRLRKEMGQRARQMILKDFEWDLLAERFLKAVETDEDSADWIAC